MKKNDKSYVALPCDLEAERIVLGCLLIGDSKAPEIFELLVVDDFFDSRHKLIYQAAKNLFERGLSCELPMTSSELSSMGDLDEAGSAAYISTLIDGLPHKTPIGQFSAKVRAKRILREIAHACEEAKQSAFLADSQATPAAEVIDSFLERLSAIGKMAESDDRGETKKESSISLLFTLEDRSQIRVFTGVPTIDETTGGFRSGELIVLTAETGVGKTFFALQIGERSCKDGHHVLYCSGEMMAEHLMGRVISADAGVDYWKIRRPERINQDDRKALLESASRQCSICRILDGELTLSRIRMAARSMSSNKELGCIIVDYDELVEVRGKDEWEQQRNLVRALKSLGMEVGVPVIEVSQLRKSLDPADRKRPTLQRLYGTGAKSKHPSVVIHVDRKYVQELRGDETEAQIFILKNRDGRLGMVPCLFNIKTFRFEEKAT